jgi:hypothetical protein
MLFNCPERPYLGGIAPTLCPIKWDQIQKLVFGRKDDDRFPNAGSFLSQAHWQALLNATDDSRLVITPYVSGLDIPATEPVTQGGNDNTTVNGVREIMGGQFVTVPMVLKNVSSQTADELRQIASETMIQPGVSNIQAFFLATDNNVIYDETVNRDKYYGFTIYNLFVPDIASAGLNTNTMYNVSFDLAFGWSQYWALQQLPFNPRELENPAS